jgi:RNA polymerase sigma factor (sigma-70 family)
MPAPSESSNAEARDRIASAYQQHHGLLHYLVVRKFGIPDEDARDVLHDVFLAFIRNHERIRGDERSWLVGATFIECRQYWRAKKRDDVLCELSGDVAALAEDLSARADASRVLRQLKPDCRTLLRLRYFEELSGDELAVHFATTTNYARKLVHQCLLKARALLRLRSSR